ncbi:unnamed protein product [Vitrella brassicaformis CCMP3155]|uniref:Uncharacterized protein n=1 Tax=Vitrella brassicaformis (strain CCMP3155) TaxID=1169540 RepID=A0A0G4FMN6_VITBC|nr:unnamed protein product [Vitrella brassicaformis CCMP3155]|eukprot:CEM14838.1 unnamed protein product [Vitrella brassicaformis CCMP3155]
MEEASSSSAAAVDVLQADHLEHSSVSDLHPRQTSDGMTMVPPSPGPSPSRCAARMADRLRLPRAGGTPSPPLNTRSPFHLNYRILAEAASAFPSCPPPPFPPPVTSSKQSTHDAGQQQQHCSWVDAAAEGGCVGQPLCGGGGAGDGDGDGGAAYEYFGGDVGQWEGIMTAAGDGEGGGWDHGQQGQGYGPYGISYCGHHGDDSMGSMGSGVVVAGESIAVGVGVGVDVGNSCEYEEALCNDDVQTTAMEEASTAEQPSRSLSQLVTNILTAHGQEEHPHQQTHPHPQQQEQQQQHSVSHQHQQQHQQTDPSLPLTSTPPPFHKQTTPRSSLGLSDRSDTPVGLTGGSNTTTTTTQPKTITFSPTPTPTATATATDEDRSKGGQEDPLPACFEERFVEWFDLGRVGGYTMEDLGGEERGLVQRVVGLVERGKPDLCVTNVEMHVNAVRGEEGGGGGADGATDVLVIFRAEGLLSSQTPKWTPPILQSVHTILTAAGLSAHLSPTHLTVTVGSPPSLSIILRFAPAIHPPWRAATCTNTLPNIQEEEAREGGGENENGKAGAGVVGPVGAVSSDPSPSPHHRAVESPLLSSGDMPSSPKSTPTPTPTPSHPAADAEARQPSPEADRRTSKPAARAAAAVRPFSEVGRAMPVPYTQQKEREREKEKSWHDHQQEQTRGGGVDAGVGVGVGGHVYTPQTHSHSQIETHSQPQSSLFQPQPARVYTPQHLYQQQYPLFVQRAAPERHAFYPSRHPPHPPPPYEDNNHPQQQQQETHKTSPTPTRTTTHKSAARVFVPSSGFSHGNNHHHQQRQQQQQQQQRGAGGARTYYQPAQCYVPVGSRVKGDRGGGGK